MSGWTGGYVADIEYIPGYYRQQSPPHIALACLLGGAMGDLPGGAEGAHYLELGCGQGIGALLIAAANPSWRVTAVDYNPAHVAAARRLAHEAGIGNALFLEADLARLAGGAEARAIPAAEVVSLHGVWSWVAPEVQAGIVRLLADKVAPGGLVHVSYNALPGWQGAIGLQRLVLEGGRRAGSRSDRQVIAGLQLARDLHEAGASHLRGDPLAGKLIERMASAPLEYLAHEYMNAHWSPCFHGDVAAALAEAKLDWVASANLLENFPELTMTGPQRAIMERFDDPVMRELVKDSCLPRQLRHDVFVRGPRRLPAAARDAALSEATLALAVPAAQFEFEMDVPAGRAQLGPAFRPIVAALDAGPARVGALLRGVDGRSNPAELPGVLVGTNQAIPVARPGAEQAPSAVRLNRVLGRRIASVIGPESAGGLASHALGAALPATRLDQFVYARVLDGEDAGAMDAWVDALGAGLDDEKRGKLRDVMVHTVEQRVPIMRRAGVL